jgi:xanthine dehydrogenase accessory factor
MMSAAMSRRAQRLAARGVPFVTATVVHARRPTSVEVGNVALVHADGEIEGFVGGVCSEHSVRAYALKALETGEGVLLRILPFAEEGETVSAPDDGAVTVQNPCLSGGAIELFLEPVLPAPRVLVVGDTPITTAVLRIGAELGLDVVTVTGDGFEPQPNDLGLVVAAHGRDELHTLRRGLEVGIPYVGLVASPRRGAGVLGELRSDGVSKKALAQIDVPAGIDIGARTPPEIALSILARIVAVRRERRSTATRIEPAAEPDASALAVDPICGMTVARLETTPSGRYDGETVYFCCDGCKTRYEAQREHAAVAD